MANYVRVEDKRNTSKGVTPNKAIKRGSPPPVKKAMSYRKQGK
jgi:hypothetical protein